MKIIDLSIIIISYNTREITLNCLNSIEKSLQVKKLACEVIIIDNASTDGSQQAFLKLQPTTYTLRLVENKQNTGFAKANNQGIKLASGNYILFLNSDTLVIDDAISRLFEFYRKSESTCHFVGAKLFNADHTPQQSCGPFYSLPVVFAALFLRGDYLNITRYSPKLVKEVDWVSGACFITKKSYYEKLNGFDEEIFMYMDEIDLFYRAKKQGMKVFFYPDSHFIHLGSASSNGRTQPILQVYKGFLYFYKRHHSHYSLLLLKILLQLKALTALIIGKATSNQYLITTYEKAFKLVAMD